MLPRPAGKVKFVPCQVRTYVVSVSPSRVYPGKKMPRTYSVRKTFLFEQYDRLLNKNSPLLFLTHKNFSAQQFIRLRRDIGRVCSPAPLSPASVSEKQLDQPNLVVIRTGLMGVVLRDRLTLDMQSKRALAKLVSPGALAVLTLPDFHPPQLSTLLHALERAVPPKKPPLTPAEEEAEKAAARLAIIENPTPGRRQKRVRPDLPPELELKGALIEGRLFVREELKDLGKLPTLSTLREQLLGLIKGPAAQLVGTIGAAGGGQLTRTLEGFKKGLEVGAEDSVVKTRQ